MFYSVQSIASDVHGSHRLSVPPKKEFDEKSSCNIQQHNGVEVSIRIYTTECRKHLVVYNHSCNHWTNQIDSLEVSKSVRYLLGGLDTLF